MIRGEDGKQSLIRKDRHLFKKCIGIIDVKLLLYCYKVIII